MRRKILRLKCVCLGKQANETSYEVRYFSQDGSKRKKLEAEIKEIEGQKYAVFLRLNIFQFMV